MRRALVPILALACAVLLLAACGSSSSNSSTSGGSSASTSAGSSASTSGGSGSAQPTSDTTKAAKFAQCMRANGVPDFPDPSADGKFSLKVTKGGDLNPNSGAFQSAEQKCKSLEPAGFGAGSSQSPAQQSQLLKFVSCMRSHGVSNFPDPSSSGQMILKGGSGGVDPNSPTFKTAMQSCRSLLPNGGNGSGVSAGG